MAAPTSEEKIALLKFEERVRDLLRSEQSEDERFLLRWLRAREMNLDKAETMLRNSMKWREEGKVDEVLDSPPDPYFLTNYPFDVNGRDRDGRPVVVLPIGKWDIRKAVDDGRSEDLPQFFNYFFETVLMKIRGSESTSLPHTQMVTIVDFEGYSLAQFTNLKAVQSILKLVGTYEAHYPEVLYEAYCINCSTAFQMLFSLLKKILPERTVGKIKIYNTKQSEWQSEMNEQINLEALQAQIAHPKCKLSSMTI